ncbi:uncharacterized protein LOC144619019 [Crassostrea virginica]
MQVKVFPREYKRALREMVEEEEGKKNVEVPNGKINGGTDDNIEEEEATIEEVAEKGKSAVVDIEEAIPNVKQKQKNLEKLDKLRGFMKYERATYQYRDIKTRQKDWKEIYNHKVVKEGLQQQAARCMDCGVPFCQSHGGCPLSNIIPKCLESLLPR